VLNLSLGGHDPASTLLTQEQWLAEINKMRSAFGASIPANQIDALANYLSSIANR
jgi:hypothetical protein